MTRKQKQAYEETQVLRLFMETLINRKFRLDCGHYLTVGYFLGNNIIIYNGKKLRITCTECGY